MSDDIKKGLLGIVVDETEVSKVMPEINSLTYRGYAAQDLCEYCKFEEVAYLILNKDLPNTIQLKKFEKEESKAAEEVERHRKRQKRMEEEDEETRRLMEAQKKAAEDADAARKRREELLAELDRHDKEAREAKEARKREGD